MTKILRIDYSPYTLEFKYHPNSKTNHLKRNGFLLKILFKDHGFGYADCHPLEEFGDLSVQSQLDFLRVKKFSELTQRSSYFALLDAKYRNQKVSAFNLDLKSKITKNHFTAPAFLKKEDVLSKKNEGFEKFKFKFGRHITNEINYLNDNFKFFLDNQIKIRLDYNGAIRKKNVLDDLKNYKEIIDFIEDPFDSVTGENLSFLQQHISDLTFAIDFIKPEEVSKTDISRVFPYRVLKPARDNYLKQESGLKQKIIFTTSMDHPLGQICALYESCLYPTHEHSGLITHHLFESNSYSEQLVVNDAKLLPIEGVGFGFEHLLKKEKWKNVFSSQ